MNGWYGRIGLCTSRQFMNAPKTNALKRDEQNQRHRYLSSRLQAYVTRYKRIHVWSFAISSTRFVPVRFVAKRYILQQKW